MAAWPLVLWHKLARAGLSQPAPGGGNHRLAAALLDDREQRSDVGQSRSENPPIGSGVADQQIVNLTQRALRCAAGRRDRAD
jgi:hypothetical protein